MKSKKRIVTLSLVVLLFLSLQAQEAPISYSSVPGATLTGVITDHGVDYDGDGVYDSLEIGVQVNVVKAAYYGISLKGFVSSNSSIINIKPEILLEPHKVGLQKINITVYGPWIHSFEQNPVKIASLTLLGLDSVAIMEITDVPLSREYKYIEFNSPGAYLTGLVTDHGLDTDEDGVYDWLEIDVEVNVTKPSDNGYRVNIPGRRNSPFGWTGATGSAFEPGAQIVPIQIDGRGLRAVGMNISAVPSITITDDTGNTIGEIHNVTLSKTYFPTEFNPSALMTGKISDRGVDLDGDGKFDSLDVIVEVNVTQIDELGNYVSVLLSENVGGSNSTRLVLGMNYVTVHIDGPIIYAYQLNPDKVTLQKWVGYFGPYELSNIQLSRRYLYTEFDEPQVAVGDWAEYAVNATWLSSDPKATEPAQVKEQKQVSWLKIQIQNVSNVITMSQVYHYLNGTEKTKDPISGSPKYSFLTYIIPNNLNKGDRIKGEYFSLNPVDIEEGEYAGAERELVYTNFTMSFFGANITMGMHWDRHTGILCEMNTTTSYKFGNATTRQSTQTRIIETNLWKITTSISCAASTNAVKEGDSTIVSGSVNPDVSGVTVTLTYTKPDGSKFNRTATTDEKGVYSDKYPLDMAGPWKVSASWGGDNSHTEANSPEFLITVTPKPFLETPIGFAAVGVFIIVLLAAAFTLYKSRARKSNFPIK
jgi:hypothetical protein